MKKRKLKLFFSLVPFFISIHTGAQEITEFRKEQLELSTEKNDLTPVDDSYEMDLSEYLKHPVNLNTASEDILVSLHMLNVLQIRNFISYRKLLGRLISIHELQAVPGWDLQTIRNLLPYIRIGPDESIYSALKERWKKGDASVLMRSGEVLEKSKGFQKPADSSTSYYEGSALQLFIRYDYNYRNLLTYGFSGDKDAGEPFFRKAQRYGFDFYSFHFFLQRVGIIRALSLGDFTINMGQGLIQWQTFATTKSSQVLMIKRESECIKPYHAAGEYNFHRGIAISLQKGKWQTNFFLSSQRISSNMITDTAGRQDLFSSFEQSGYHRTPAEQADRNNNRQYSTGFNIRYTGERFDIGLNGIGFQFSQSLQKKDEPYNLYSLKGRHLADFSVDYSHTYKNVHLFGELAMDQWRHRAFLQGILISLGENIDISFLYRNISVAYQSLYSNAFTENTTPNNEKGFYAGLSVRPMAGWQINMYFDLFDFPWLKYLVDAPSWGRDLLFQSVYQPNKSWRLTILYKNGIKAGNAPTENPVMHGITAPVTEQWRFEMEYTASRKWQFSSRMEVLRIRLQGAADRYGYLEMMGLGYHPRGFSGNMGTAVFETDDYDTRIYAFEPDLLYHFSLPVFYGRGIHYYINVHRDFTRLFNRWPAHFKLSGWLNWVQTFYPGAMSVGTGLDEIPGNRKSEIKAEVLIQWQ